jgi:hypothetical protein
MDDTELYSQIAAAQTLAVSKLQERYGLTNDQMAKASAGIAAPKQTTPDTVTTADLAAAWARSANDQFRSLGISPVTDEEAAKIQEAQAAAVAKMQADRASEMDDQLHNFRREWDNGQTDPTSIYYRADPKMRDRMEADMMLVRLEAGLPAEPAPRKTPVQVAQERFDARRKAQQS